MSAQLKPLDLTGAIIGTKGTIDFNQFTKYAPMDKTVKAAICLFNESGCGLNLVFQASGNNHYLPAGGWGKFDLEPNDGSILVTVTYILPNPPVSSLNAVYYTPGEQVPAAFTLGNSPIGIGGTVNTVGGTASSIQNDGNPTSTTILEATVSGDGASAVTLKNSGEFVLGDGTHPGSFILTSGKLGKTTVGDMLDMASVANEMHVNATGGDIVFLTNATEIGRFTNAGAIKTAGETVVLNGSTSGTLTLIQPFEGNTYKKLLCYFLNFRSAGAQSITIPTAFTNRSRVICQDLPSTGIQCLLASVAQNFSIITALAAAGGAHSNQTTLNGTSIAELLSGFDTISIPGAGAGTTTGLMIFEGQ